jgi:hypothetical protein
VSNGYKNLTEKLEEKRTSGRPKLRWEDNMIVDLRGGRMWTGFMWLRIGTRGGHLLT